MAASYLPLRCGNGECGLLLSGPNGRCPSSCGLYKRCSQCLTAPGCGWCAVNGANGMGVCLEGGVQQPLRSNCRAGNTVMDDGSPIPGD